MNTFLPEAQYTKEVFARLVRTVSPVLPDELEEEVRHAVSHMSDDASLTREDVERTMIVFGKRIWPYRKALNDALALHEKKVGLAFFRGALSRATRVLCDEFFAHGGTIADIRSGGPAQLFSETQRVELAHVLVDMDTALRAYVVQWAKGTGRAVFQASVESFHQLLLRFEEEIRIMEHMADDEQQHPLLAREIREHVRAFEYGLVCLGQEYSHDALKQSHDHFYGRRRELVVRVR